jgi:glycosyltransferase involved in cell wall biosynthesis
MTADRRPLTARKSAGGGLPCSVALSGWFLQSPATGTGQYLRQLSAELLPLARECGFEVNLIAPRSDTTVDAPLHVAAPHLNDNLGKVEFEHLTFPRAAQRAGCALAHVPYFGSPLFPSLPTVVTIHDLIPMILPEYRGSPAVRLYTHLAAAGARRARMILADSEASRRDILAHLGISAERVRVVYLAADVRFRPARDSGELARVRAKYNLPERFVFYIGGFDVRKNVRVVVEAFDALEAERAAGWKLVLAGRLPETNTPFFPDPRVGASEAVQFIGHVPEEDKPALFAAAGAFVYPSLYEGFGLPPLEALACSTPVLCANTSSLPEVVGGAGILINPREVSAWTAALRAVLNDEMLRRDLGARGLLQAKKFSWARTARATLEVYDHLINESLSATIKTR